MAMQQLIAQIKQHIPFTLAEAQICQGACVGCPKKMIELLETELSNWQYSSDLVGLKELKHLENLAHRTHKLLRRNKLIP